VVVSEVEAVLVPALLRSLWCVLRYHCSIMSSSASVPVVVQAGPVSARSVSVPVVVQSVCSPALVVVYVTGSVPQLVLLV